MMEHIRTRKTKHGVASDLYYRWQGKRHRPLLGYDLAPNEAEQRAIVGRALDDHGVAVFHQQLEQERVRLHRAVGDQHAFGGNAVSFRDPLAQRRVADGGPFLKNSAEVLRSHPPLPPVSGAFYRASERSTLP